MHGARTELYVPKKTNGTLKHSTLKVYIKPRQQNTGTGS